jgi:hypothetical protein
MQAPGAYRLGQRIGFHTNPLGYLRDFQSLIKLFLRLLQHLRSQHRRSPRLRLLIKSRDPFLPIELNGPFDADERDAKGARNIRLFGVSIDAKLRGDHAKGRNIILGVNEYRHVPVEIGDLTIPFFKGQFRGDVLHTIREQGQLHLRHSGNPSKDLLGFDRHLASSAA